MKISSGKNSRKFVAFAAILTVISSMVATQPAAATDAITFTYSENSNQELTITGYTSFLPRDITIPSTIDGKKVVAIGERAFIGEYFSKLVISEGVREIAKQAFMFSDIDEVQFPESLTKIGYQGFDPWGSIKKATFLGNAPECGTRCIPFFQNFSHVYAYNDATGFGDVWQNAPVTYLERLQYTISESEATITGYVGTPASDYSIPSTLGGAPVVAIADDAFSEKGLTSIKLPKTLRSIGARAFAVNSLASVTIPKSVTEIGQLAFSINPTLASVTFEGNAPASGGSLFLITSQDLTSLTIRPGATGFGSLYEMLPLIELEPPSTVAILSLLAPSIGSFTPSFSPDVHNYSITIPYSTDFFGLTPNPESGFGTVTLNGEPIEGWQTSYVLPNVGDNTYTFICTAQDGETTETYTVVVTREAAPSNDSSLKNLVPSVGKLVSAGWYDYTVSVASGQSTIDITATVNEAHAGLKIQGEVATSGESKTVNLAVGANTIDIEVTSQSGLNKTNYRVIVTREAPVVLSSDATLAGIAIDNGTLSPSFASLSTSYQTSVAYGTSSVRVTPNQSESHATVKVNGASVSAGASKSVALSVGSNVVTIEVLAQDGSTKKTYSLTITRAAASSTATLSGLVVKNVALSSTFGSNTLNYTSSVAYSVTSYTVTATLTDSQAQLKINGASVSSGTETGSISLATGVNTISVEVLAQDGTTKKTYTVTVTRAAADSNANLSALSAESATLSPKFASGTTNYTATVAYATASLSLTATLVNANASLKIKGAQATSGVATSKQNLAVGQNVFAIEVTAQDGSKKTYNLTITRIAASAEATLAVFAPGAGNFNEAFSTARTSYTQSVLSTVSKIQVRGTTTNDKATIKVNGTSVSSGDLSAQINLNVGVNTITVEVTAENGTAKKVYTLVVTRAAPVVLSNDARLKSLLVGREALSSSELTSGATKAIKVDQSVANIQFTPTVNESHATIKINGRTMVSGKQTGTFSLNMGANTFNVVVTAENGADTKTYSVVITRKVFSNNSKLKSLTSDLGALDSVFSAIKTSYSKTVPYATAKATFTVATDDSFAAVTIEGQLPNGSGSATVDLAVGANVIDVVVAAENGTVTAYKVTVSRTAASTNSKLKSLITNVGTLDSSFSASKLKYSTTVAASVDTIVLTVLEDDALAEVRVGTSTPDVSNQVTLKPAVGDNTYNIQVTAENGSKTTYSLSVKRQSSADKIVVGAISISGQNSVGSTLTAKIGDGGKGNPTPTTFTYSWYRCGSKMAGQREINVTCKVLTGAIGTTYKVTSADLDKYISVYIVASNGIDVGTALSRSTEKITK